MALLRAKQPPDAQGHVSPERAALAAAIAAYAESEATHAATVTAGERASEAVWAAQERVTAATVAVEEAKDAAVHHLVALSAGTAGTPPTTIRQARDALADAEEGLEAARAAREMLRVRLNELGTQRLFPKSRLQVAAMAVLRAEGADAALALAAEVDRLQRAVIRQGESLMWLASRGMFPAGTTPPMISDPAIRATVNRMQMLAQFGGQAWTELRGEVPWEAALAALMADAGAALPGAAS